MNDGYSEIVQINRGDGKMDIKLAALFVEAGTKVYDYEEVKPKKVKSAYREMVPWGEGNDTPTTVLQKIQDDEVMSSNMDFNIKTCYGRGFNYTNQDGSPVTNEDIKRFFRRNNMIKLWAEQITDIKYFYFTVFLMVLDRAGKNIVSIRHTDAMNVRFETCNKKTGKIENIFVASWKDNPKDDDIIAYPVLDEDDPVGDLMVRLGKEPDPATGKKNTPTSARTFAILTKVPTPGLKYYPFPSYYSTFNSGWATLKAMIPSAKVARLRNGMTIKYIVELHKDYFTRIFEVENITDLTDKKERKKKEIKNIRDFLSGVENQNKSWISTYYVDPNGKEQRMVRIDVLPVNKEGGEFIEDSEEASNIVSYAMGVHPSLIGSSPGKNKNISGTEARELFTMKQALEKFTRDLMLIPFGVLNDVNGWDLKFEIPDLMLTTLDKGTDAVVSTQSQNQENDSE